MWALVSSEVAAGEEGPGCPKSAHKTRVPAHDVHATASKRSLFNSATQSEESSDSELDDSGVSDDSDSPTVQSLKERAQAQKSARAKGPLFSTSSIRPELKVTSHVSCIQASHSYITNTNTHPLHSHARMTLNLHRGSQQTSSASSKQRSGRTIVGQTSVGTIPESFTALAA